jgi:hypothetical protein
MPSYIPYLMESLSAFERESDDRLNVERGVAAALLRLIFEADWFAKHVELSDSPDPWMLNASQKWITSHPVPQPDLRPLVYSNRVVRLGDAWFTLVKHEFKGLETLRQRFLKRNDTRASFTETEVASLLIYNGCSVRAVEELGIRGHDFDLAATIRGVEVSVEVTSIDEGPLLLSRVLNKLHGKRNQVRFDRPAVLYVHIPEAWMRQRSFAVLVMGAAIRRFFIKSRRYNMIVFIWDIKSANGTVQTFFQPVFNNRARFRLPDYTAFTIKRDKWGISRRSESLLGALQRFRTRQLSEAGRS